MRFSWDAMGKEKRCTTDFTPTVSIQVIGLIGPAGGLGRVAGRHAAASAILCQEVRQSEGLPLFILLLSCKR